MGLDMYLVYKVKGVKEEEDIIYWRKMNAIHLWFVKNVQNGLDDCGEYLVSLEKLKLLLKTINKVFGLNPKDRIINSLDLTIPAKEFLPTAGGFFFGSTEYDEWYFRELKRTREVLTNILKREGEIKQEGGEFFYSSSW